MEDPHPWERQDEVEEAAFEPGVEEQVQVCPAPGLAGLRRDRGRRDQLGQRHQASGRRQCQQGSLSELDSDHAQPREPCRAFTCDFRQQGSRTRVRGGETARGRHQRHVERAREPGGGKWELRARPPGSSPA